jgi:hypothetical protein
MIVPCAKHSPARSSEFHTLRNRFRKQIGERDSDVDKMLTETFAVTFRPGDRTSTFRDKTLRPLGASVAVVLTNGGETYAPVLAGYRAMLHSDGSVGYGLADDYEFRHRADLMPGSPGAVDPQRNPSLVDALLRLDKACANSVRDPERIPFVPQLPRILLGFDPSQPPEFEMTPALNRRAVAEIGITLLQLESNPPELSERLLRQTWESKLLAPGATSNPTGLFLLDAEFCTQARNAVRCFEDFSRLVGAPTWNPARSMELFSAPNPAAQILANHDIDPNKGFDTVAAPTLERLEAELRLVLADQAVRFSQEDLFDGLTQPDLPLVAVSEVLPRLRGRLTPYYSECTTDGDLRRAAYRPDEPLRVSGACRVQTVRKRAVPEPYFFAEEDLQRRVRLDWGASHPFQAKRSPKRRVTVGAV